jgi:hypothetical protein
VAALPLDGGKVKGPGEGEAGEQAGDEVQPWAGNAPPPAVGDRLMYCAQLPSPQIGLWLPCAYCITNLTLKYQPTTTDTMPAR